MQLRANNALEQKTFHSFRGQYASIQRSKTDVTHYIKSQYILDLSKDKSFTSVYAALLHFSTKMFSLRITSDFPVIPDG
jgi:hypothetical protein